MALRLLEAGGVRLRPAPDAPEALRLGDVVLRPLEADEGGYVGVDDRGYQFLIDYRRGVDFLPRYWLSDVLEGRVPEDAFAGRLVFVGAMTETVKDYFYTPLNETSAVTDAVVPYAVPGVTLHAIMTDQLLRHALDGAPPTRTTGWPVEVLVIWLACLAGGALGLLLPSTLQFATGMAAGLGGLALLWFAALGQAIWLPLVAPAAGWLASGALVVASVSKAQAAARSELMRLLSMHVSAPIARELWRHRDMLLEQGRLVPQRLVATVLFSDIRDSSGVAERLEPQRLAEWLNEYFQVMVDIVAAHDGIVIRFIGDAILAVFGLPVPREGEAAIRADAVRATRCAAAMAEALVRLNRNLEARGLPPIAIRIGLHTGSLAAGSLGSARRLEYNVIGDTVNTAARLEALGKDIAENRAENRVWGHPCTIIVGAATWHRLGGTFAGEAIGTVALRGKAEEILAYRLVPSQADAAVPTREDSHVRQNDRTGIGSGACRAGRGG
jgi:adenylate cyclase